MKILKKALAAFLAVLMVVFSVPLTAVAAEDIISVPLHVYQYIGVDYWGPYVEEIPGEESPYELDADTQLYEGDTVVIAFELPFDGLFKGMGIKGHYDLSKITPAYYYKQGRNEKLQIDAFNRPGVETKAIQMGMNGSTVADLDINDARTYFYNGNFDSKGWPQFNVAKNSLHGYATFTGTTVNDTFGEFDYTMIHAHSFQIKQDMKVADLYSCFDTDPTDIKNNSVTTTLDGTPETGYMISVQLAPLEEEQPTEDVYTYTFADGSSKEVKVPAGTEPTAPDNTPDTAFEHVAETDTHAKTTYSWVADGDKAFKEAANVVTEDCAMNEVPGSAKEPIHTKDELVNGKEADTKCDICGNTKVGAEIVAEHNCTVTEVPATCKVRAHKHYECACGYAYDSDFTGELADHTWKQVSVEDADCVTPGRVHYECEVCGETKVEEGALGDHTLTHHDAVPATCTKDGTIEYWSCSVCGKNFADEKGKVEVTDLVDPAKGHTEGEPEVTVVEPTCTTDGSRRTVVKCTVCGEVIKDETETLKALGHDLYDVEGKEATRGEAGYEAGKKCTRCDYTEGFAVIPALGVNITVNGSSLGTVTLNDADAAGKTTNVPYEKAYTLTATPNDGVEFLGWKVNSKIVSTELTYTTDAFADMTYTPVFVENTAESFTITFVDAYGNVIDTVSGAELPLAELPAATEFAGLTFAGWNLTFDEVNALTKSTTVTAKYDNDESKSYTITATGCTITVDGVEYTDTATATYNSKVTVTSEGATAWTVNSSTEPAAYGDTYTFFCGSDITVTPVTDVVTAVPTVTMVSADKTENHRVTFLATRAIPAGYELIESGFVYGKGMTEEDLVLENVGKLGTTEDAGTVKQVVTQNKGADGQFSLTYGVTAMDNTACARAYAICRTADGTSVVYYSDAMIYNY